MKSFKPKKFEGAEYKWNKKALELYQNPKWRSYSYEFLKHNPKCYCCADAAIVTDHIVAHKGDETLFWKIDNMMPLCTRCHNTITASFDRHFKQKIKEKLEFIAASRRNNLVAIKVKVVPLSFID